MQLKSGWYDIHIMLIIQIKIETIVNKIYGDRLRYYVHGTLMKIIFKTSIQTYNKYKILKHNIQYKNYSNTQNDPVIVLSNVFYVLI